MPDDASGAKPEKAMLALLAALVLIASVAGGQAAEVRVEGDRPGQEITVHIEDASVESTLGMLAKTFGFEFVGPETPRSSSALSATLSGTLEAVLARLLRNRNHSIVRAGDAPGGIRRVVLIDSRLGSNLTPAERPGYRRPSAPARKARPAAKTSPTPAGAKPR